MTGPNNIETIQESCVGWSGDHPSDDDLRTLIWTLANDDDAMDAFCAELAEQHVAMTRPHRPGFGLRSAARDILRDVRASLYAALCGLERRIGAVGRWRVLGNYWTGSAGHSFGRRI